MRGIVLYAALLGAVAGYRSSSFVGQQLNDSAAATSGPDVGATSEKMISTSSAAPVGVSSSARPPATAAPLRVEPTLPEVVSEEPVSLPPLLKPEEEMGVSKRRVTYDQRQEGQYNIRADLDNFMILLIPPSPTDGMNLLDLLTKSAFRRNSLAAKGKLKPHAHLTPIQPEVLRFRNTMLGGQHLDYLPKQSESAAGSRSYGSSLGMAMESGIEPSSTSPFSSSSSVRRLSDFFEGRKPYNLEMKSENDEEQPGRLQPDRPVDVLPPPYPVAYQHLIKPFHLEAEPTVIQALPPQDLSPAQVAGNFLETYNQILASKIQSNNEADQHLSIDPQESSKSNKNNSNKNKKSSQNNGFYRFSRAIHSDSFLDSNRVTSLNSLPSYPPTLRRTPLPLYRADLSFGASQLYPPIDVPRLSGYLSFNSNAHHSDLTASSAEAYDSAQSLDGDLTSGETIIGPHSFSLDDDLEYEHHGDGFMDAEAKALLSDGIERCAPGRRRDSYGVCREIDGY